MTISPLTFEQLVPPLPVHFCQVSLGWVSVCCVPMTQAEAPEAKKATTVFIASGEGITEDSSVSDEGSRCLRSCCEEPLSLYTLHAAHSRHISKCLLSCPLSSKGSWRSVSRFASSTVIDFRVQQTTGRSPSSPAWETCFCRMPWILSRTTTDVGNIARQLLGVPDPDLDPCRVEAIMRHVIAPRQKS
jgi:hypothetical protein